MAIRKPTLSDEARSTKKLHLLKGSEKEGSKANQTDFFSKYCILLSQYMLIL